MQLAKLKVGKMVSARIKVWDATNKAKPLNLLAEEDGFYYYDSEPENAGDIVKVQKYNEATRSYSLLIDGNTVEMPEEVVEIVEGSEASMSKLNVVSVLTTTKKARDTAKTVNESKTRKRQDKVFSGNRQEQIKSCTKCNGEPQLTNFELPDFTGLRCTECYLISEYKSK